MLFELIIFAIVLAGMNVVGGLVMFKILMTKITDEKFLKDYSKRIMKTTLEIQEELYEED